MIKFKYKEINVRDGKTDTVGAYYTGSNKTRDVIDSVTGETTQEPYFDGTRLKDFKHDFNKGSTKAEVTDRMNTKLGVIASENNRTPIERQ